MPTRDDDERRVSPFPTPLNTVHISGALHRSPDGGVTLFLAKLGLSDVGADEARELALVRGKGRTDADSGVERLALGNNRLTTLPTEFALLTHLRYLNLRHNAFSTFPDVLTLMPSLDTLDISCNKIKRLPSHAGNLIRLKVFSFARNKVTRLPAYLAQFHQLEVLQIERNPIEWPPRSVVDSFGDVPDMSNGRVWIRKLQAWLETEGPTSRDFDDSGYSEQPEWDNENSYDSWRFPIREASDASLTPHARSFSVDSNNSASSILNASYDSDTQKEKSYSKRKPINLTNGLPNGKVMTRTADDGISTSYSATSYTSSHTASPTVMNPPHELLPEPDPMHLRTTSHASAFRKPQSSSMGVKKSLPDLRVTNKDTKKVVPALPERRSPNTIKPLEKRSVSGSRQDSGSSSGSVPPPYGEDASSPGSRVVPLLVVERNAYFRRSSTLPANLLPKSLMVLLESARSILFSMGQLYQTLEQYVHQGANERLLTIFKKVLEPANLNMLHLIRSLDRFDDVSRKTVPTAAVCRALVESCRDTVTVFRKAVGLMTSQIGVESSEDPRYVRWLILEMHAATTELSIAWQSMVPYIESLKPFLYGTSFLKAPNHSTSSHPEHLGMTHLSASSDSLGPALRLRPVDGPGSHGGTRTRTARRHAGSFSFKDVQMGKELPVFDLPPVSGLASQTPTLRTPKRQVTLPMVTTSTPNSSPYPLNAPGYFGSISDSPSHKRHASHTSLTDTPSLGSPALSLESPAGNKSQTDRGIIQAVQSAIDLAPAVWDQLEDAMVDSGISDHDLQENIDQARSLTKRLSDDIAIMSEGHSDADERLLRENAHLFIKTIVHLSNIVATYGSVMPPELRANLPRLTTLTQEFAVLLQISSMSSYLPQSSSPTSTPKYAPYNSTSYPTEDNLLVSSLSRSRSEQPITTNSKLQLSSAYDGSRGTAPLAFTKNPNARRLRLPREAHNDNSDPG